MSRRHYRRDTPVAPPLFPWARLTSRAMSAVEDRPNYCPNGHPFGPDKVLVGWRPPPVGQVGPGSRTYECLQCGAIMDWKPTLTPASGPHR